MAVEKINTTLNIFATFFLNRLMSKHLPIFNSSKIVTWSLVLTKFYKLVFELSNSFLVVFTTSLYKAQPLCKRGRLFAEL